MVDTHTHTHWLNHSPALTDTRSGEHPFTDTQSQTPKCHRATASYNSNCVVSNVWGNLDSQIHLDATLSLTCTGLLNSYSSQPSGTSETLSHALDI